MKNATALLEPMATPYGSDSVFNVVIAYEDFETGKLAKRTYDYLLKHLGDDCELCHQMWKFEVLGLPRLRQYGVQDAREGDLVIVATHGPELPESVREWLESWAEHAPRTLALVLLSDSAPEETRGVHSYLAKVACKAGVEFFAQPGAWPVINDADGPKPRNRSQDQTYSALSDVLTRDIGVAHWSR